MKLKVENFGPIRKAEVVLGPMTVFVGPSNTGKSYLAGLVYAVMGALNEAQLGSVWQQIRELNGPHGKERSGLLEFVRTTDVDPEKQEKHLSATIDELFLLWANDASEAWKRSVAHCFGEEGKDMLNANDLVVQISGQREFGIVLDLCAPANSKIQDTAKNALDMMSEMFKGKQQRTGRLEILYALFCLGDDQDNLENARGRFAVFEFVTNICYSLVMLLCHSLLYFDNKGGSNVHVQPHYLPASRGGIMQGRHALVRSALRDAAATEHGAAASFTGIVSDFLSKMATLPDVQKRSDAHAAKAKIAKIGKSMEKGIMAGEIEVKMSETNYPDFRYTFQRSGKPYSLPLMNAASMVAELAPFSIYMRYYVAPGDLLIIEEPETGLHPGAQRDITNILVQLVNAGVRVMITTHSDTVLEQLGNSIFASKMDTKITKQKLKEEKISVYLFRRPKSQRKGTAVKRIPFDEDGGILTEDHLDVSSALYNESVRLYNASQQTAEKEKKNDA